MSIPREQQDVLVAMGVALLLLQIVERVIRVCMTFVLQKGAPLTLDRLQQQQESERTKALGYFLSELRKRACVDDGFDQLLRDFLRNRNNFIHGISGWGLGTPEETAEAKQFVHQLIWQADEVLKVFAGLIRAWQEESGMSDSSFRDDEWLEEIAAVYRPLANHVFFAKDP